MSIYKSILTNFDEALKLVDHEYQIVFANKAAKNLYAFEITGKVCSELGIEGSLIIKQIQDIHTKNNEDKDEFVLKADIGTKEYFQLSVLLIEEDTRNQLYLVKTTDITARKMLETEIFQKERLATLGQVASNLAHEIRNPITGIRLGLDVLENELSSPNSNEIFTSITNDINRLDLILKQLLDYSKIHQKSKTEVNINKLISESLVLLRKEAETNNILIETDFSQILAKVIVDRNQIHQAIVNIILNAIQAIPKSGNIIISTSHININDILGVQIIISDNGSGISKDNLFKISNLFFTTKKEGTGLGLPMSQKIIREHGGSIVFESELGQGKNVKLFLAIEL